MGQEIGGYLELEEFHGREYYPGLLALNLGRTALVWLIQIRGYHKIYLPYYLCDSVIEACNASGLKVEFYHVDRMMRPLLEKIPESDACLYLVNYYGQLSDERIREYKNKYQRIIVDHVQSFFQRPLEGVDTIYSCRKFFGLPDGAYLSAGISWDEFSADQLPEDHSAGRMGHVLGRYEDGGTQHYRTMLDNAGTFHREPVKRMSRLTHNLLRGIDYELVLHKRTENYDTLHRLLGKNNGFQFSRTEGALCYPFYTPGGCKLRKKLAERQIYVPVYWGNVLQDMDVNSVEYDFAANILALPCDQRYGSEEMEQVAGTVLELLEKDNEQ